MGASGVGNLVLVDDTMGRYKNLEILRNNLKDSSNKLDMGADFL